jgi:cell division protein ZapE
MEPKKQPQTLAPSSLAAAYDALVAKGQIKEDAAQRDILAQLQRLQDELSKPVPPMGTIARLLGRKYIPPRGLYIWGNVGRGKSMLMDLFYEHVPVEKKRRLHFHAFMQEVHGRLHKLRAEERPDPVQTLARQIALDARLLCFDELQAPDVTDATLLYRLFSGLFEAGVTVVSTSNRPPSSLYTGGVQRERFAKFIALIEQHMQVMALSSPADYRHMQMKSLEQVYFHPLGAAADEFVENALGIICADCSSKQETLIVHGRRTPFTLYDTDIGRFTFHDLCESALGPADYLALSRRLDTMILTGIPALPAEKRNEAKRFVTLIDALYEQKVKLICTAATAPEGIYSEGDGSFEFRRTLSRLAEMQSAKYLEDEHA